MATKSKTSPDSSATIFCRDLHPDLSAAYVLACQHFTDSGVQPGVNLDN